MIKSIFWIFVVTSVCLIGCRSEGETVRNAQPEVESVQPPPQPTATPTPGPPNLQAELLDDRAKITQSPLGNFDFKNYTYPLPRGWQNPDGTTDITLTNGRIAPVEGRSNSDEMSDEDKVVAKSERRIGMSYVTTKFMDLTGDGQDEAIVILKIETAGSAIPQLVYIFTLRDGKPDLIWPFRTGDRADGGLKNFYMENGLFVIEMFGQDRFVLGQTETGKVTGDFEQLCCPTYWTRSFYKWNGRNFLLQGKRLTFSMADPQAAPIENLADKVNNPVPGHK